MKKPFLYGVLAASLCTVNFPSTVQAQGVIVPVASDAFDGKLRVKQGAKYNMRFFVRSNTTQSVSASMEDEGLGFKKTKSSSIYKFNANYDIVSVDVQGNHQVRITYGEFSMDVDESVDGKPRTPQAMMASKKMRDVFFEAMKGATFLMKLSPKNEVISVYGLNAIRSRIVNKIAEKQPEIRPIVEVEFADLLSDNKAIKNFGHLGGQIPQQPVRVGETWDYSVSASTGPMIASLVVPTVKGLRTLVSLKDGIAVIKDAATFTLKGKSPSSFGALDIAVKQTAITRIKNATGIPLDSTSSQTMSGTMTMTLGPKSKDIPLAFSTVNEFRCVMEER